MTDADDIPENAADTLSGDVANQNETSVETTLDSNSYDETPADAGLEAPKKPRRYGKFALGFTALSALVVGGASGGGFVKYFMPNPAASQAPSQSVDLGPLKTQIKQLADKNAKLEARLSKVDAGFKNVQASVKETVEKSVKSIDLPVAPKIDVSGLKSRLNALENAPKPTVIDEGLVSRLEALQRAGSPALDLSAIEGRLAALETNSMSDDEVLDALELLHEQQAEVDVKIEEKITIVSDDLGAVEDSLSEIQTELGQLRDNQANGLEAQGAEAEGFRQERPELSSNLIASQSSSVAFPKQALLDAIAAQTPSKPFLKRALSKHIKVKDPSSPSVILDAIEADLAKGNIEDAAARFDSLPSEIRSAARAWRETLN